MRAVPPGTPADDDSVRQLQELRSHQIELERRIEELLASRAALEASVGQYADLFEFAPVSYLTLDLAGAIHEANLTASTYLGVDRAQLLGQVFSSFLNVESCAPFCVFLEKAATAGTKETCEVSLFQNDGPPRRVRLEGLALADASGDARLCRLIIIDITEHTRDAAENRGMLDDAERTRLCLLDTVEDLTRSEAAVRAREADMAEAQRIGHFGSWERDLIACEHLGAKPLRWSNEVYRIFGLEPSAFGGTYEAFLATVHPADLDRLEAALRRAIAGEEALNLDHRIVRPDGSIRWVRELAELKRDDSGRVTRFAGTVLDITERKLAELRLHRLNRLHTVSSKVGEAIVRTRDRQELYDSVCRIVVEDGLLRMVSVMEVKGSSVLPAACAGAGCEYLETLKVTTDGGARSRGPLGTALRTGHSDFCNDFASDARMDLWRENALAYGFLSAATFPLQLSESIIGALVLFADETGYFESDEMHLMTAVANDLSFALEALQKEEQRRAATIALRASEASLADAQRRVKMGNWEFDFATQSVSWSAEMFRLYDRDPALGVPAFAEFEKLPHPEDCESVTRVVAEAIAAGLPFQQDFRVLRPDGSIRWVSRHAEIILDGDGKAVRMVGTSQDITERKRAEEVQMRLAAIVESSVDAIIGKNLDGVLTSWNPGAEKLFGYTAAEAIGRPCAMLFRPEDVNEEAEILRRTAQGETVKNFDTVRVRKDGSSVHISVTISPLSDPTGKIIGASKIAHDITEHRLAEEALRRSEASLVAAQSVAKIGSWETDLTTLAVVWSAETYRIFGVTEPDFKPTHEKFLSMVHPEDRAAVEIELSASLEDDVPRRFTHRIVLPDDACKWVEERWIVTRDEQGKALCAVGTCQDITERNESEQQLAEQAALIDQAHDAILVRDTSGNIVFWSKGAERLYGWTREETLGRSYGDLLHPDLAKFEIAQRFVDLAGDWSGELETVTKTGAKVSVNCRWTLLRNEAGQPRSYLHFDTDITEYKKIEQQYLRVQRMESIGTLAGGIAHDLNNVLAPIMMAVELLKMQERDAQRLSILKTIEISSKRGADMVGQVLSFARGVEGQQVEVQISHIIREIEALAHETFPKNIELTSNLPSGLWTVRGDPTQLHQVLLNLCVNARDAMPYGGTLVLAASNLVLDEHYSCMNIEAAPGPHVCIEVEDSGGGIPPDVIERIFEPFFTTKEVGKGTGLGLSTTMAIVKSHGGFARVYSEVGVGSRFHIYLPALTQAGALVPETLKPDLPRGQGELILVIDDEAAIRNITKQTLEAFGYRAILASDGAEAAAIYGVRKQEIAVVLTDMMMPVMDGPATIQVLMHMNPRVRIIAASGLNANGMVAKATHAGVRHFISKPYTAGALLKVLHSILHP